MPQECTDYLQNLFGNEYNILDGTAQIVLGTAFLEDEVTNVRMQSILNMHSMDVGRILSYLVAQNMLVQNSKGRWTSYRLNVEYEKVLKPIDLFDENIEELVFTNKTDRAIYEYIRANGFVTSHQIVGITRISSRSGANNALRRLIDAGYVQKVREGRHFIYKMVET